MSPRLALHDWSVALSLTLIAFGFPARATAAAIVVTPPSLIATFDFNASPMNGNQYAVNGLGITLSTGFARESGYTGDGHVVGRVINGTFVPYTLGTTDGGVAHGGDNDGFLVNRGRDRFDITFSQRVYSVAFDYEIFPNATDAPPARPDLTVKAYDGTTLVFSKRYVGAFPSETGLLRSRVSSNEQYAQLLGSDGFTFANGITRLEIIDWPVTVGIDNLYANGNAPVSAPTPEPASAFTWLLCVGAFGGAAFWLNRRRTAAAAV